MWKRMVNNMVAISLLCIGFMPLMGEAFAPSLSYRASAFRTNQPVLRAVPGLSATGASSLTMKLSRSSSKRGSGDSVLGVRNAKRIAVAGKPGTKRFVDPTKLFVGNLPYDKTEEDVKQFFREHLGHTRNIHSVNIIRDWKTGQSKGYGFVMFTDPMFATCAMEFCKNKELDGRTVSINQGKKKLDPSKLYVKKNKKKPVDEEESVILEGLEEAEQGLEELITLEDFEDSDDLLLFGDDDGEDGDLDNFEFDGVFEELYPAEAEGLTEEEEQMNREQRRDASKRKKKRKLPHKGFDALSTAYNDQFE